MATILRRKGARLAVLAALVSACAGAGGGAGGGRGLGGARLSPGSIEGGQLKPARAAASSYGTIDGACQSSGAITAVMNELAAQATRAGRPPPELDPRVCAVAETFLGWDSAAQGNPRFGVLQFVANYFGLPTLVMPPVVANLGPLPGSPASEFSNEQQIAEKLVQAIGSAALNAERPRVGLAIQRTRKGMTEVVFRVSATLADVPVDLDPLPRRLDLGQQATLSGRLAGSLVNPKVFLSDATGQLSTPEQPPGKAFRADVKCGDRPGRIQIEIRGERDGEPTMAATFPVACGQDLATAVAIAPEPWPTDPPAVEKKILDLVNEERVAAGLKPLTLDPAVSGVARSIAADIAASGGGQAGGDVGERLKKEGIASPLVLQSAAAERTYERAHGRLLTSATNRANLMNPDVTNAGVGVVEKKDPEGRTTVFVTEIFIKELPKADVAGMRQQLRDAVAQKRKDARTNPLADDPALDDVAQRFAEALAQAGGTVPKEQQSALTAPLTKGFRTVTMVSGAKQEPLDFAEEPQTTAPGRSLGVGVAVGKHPVLGRNAAYVVLMVGTPRDAPAAPAPAKRKPARK
jgi:uncharacterized protein YkwD